MLHSAIQQQSTTALPDPSVLPDDLLKASRWLVWKHVQKEGEAKPTKVPFYVDGGFRGAGGALDSPEDVSRLGTFDLASQKYVNGHGAFAGVGYALVAGDGVGGIDLDNCLDENRVFTNGIAKQVYDCAVAGGAYAEVSPSGRGLRIIGSTRGFKNFTRKGFEAYCKKRYLTITGNCLVNARGFGGIDAAVRLMDQLVPAPSAPPTTRNVMGSTLVANVAGGVYVKPDQVAAGGRNDAVLKYASHLRGSGVAEHVILEAVRDFNKAICNPPLDDEEVASIAKRYQTPKPSAEPSNWPDPQEIKAALPAVPAFDLDLLPDVFRPFVKDSAERMGQPTDYFAIPLMIVAGAVLGSTWAVAPKANDRRWLVPPVLWGGVIARSGTKKSACISLAVQPAHEIEKMLAAAHVQNLTAYSTQRIAYDNAVKMAQKAAAKQQYIAIPPEPVKPEPERLVVNDSTYQKLADIMRCSPRGLLSVADELAGTMVSWEQKGQEPARAFYLTAHNGDQPYRVDRVEAGSKLIECAFMCIVGGVQPSILASYVRQATTGGAGDDGLVQRFQMLTWPDIPAELHEVDRAHDAAAEKAAFDALLRLRNLTANDVGAEVQGRRSILIFSKPAQAVYTKFRLIIDWRARSGDLGPALSSHISKSPAVIATIAALIHLLDGGIGPIGLVATRKAIKWFYYLHAHSIRIYAGSTISGAESARNLADKLEESCLGESFTSREVSRKGWMGLGSVSEAEEACQWLCDVNWLKAEQRQGAGRPTIYYHVNPKVRK